MSAVERGEDHVELQTQDKVGGTVPSSPTCANRPSAQCRSKNSTGAWQPPSTRASGGSQRPLEGAGGGGEGTGSQCLGLADTHPAGTSSRGSRSMWTT